MQNSERLILESLFMILRTLANVEARGSIRDTMARECDTHAERINIYLRTFDAERDGPNYEQPAPMTAVERAAATADRRARAYAAAHDADPSMLARGD